MQKLSRRLKTQLNHLALLFSIFSATIAILSIVFIFFTFNGVKLISPLTKTKYQQEGFNEFLVKNECGKNHLNCQNIQKLNDGSIQLEIISPDAIIILSSKKDLKNQLASLQQALYQLTIKGKQFKKLDFRFDNPIVSF